MEPLFNQISDALLITLNKDEHLKLSFSGENSQFIRINNHKVRQTGLVQERNLSLNLIRNSRTCSGAITLTGYLEIDLLYAQSELERLRSEVDQLPEDPFIALPINLGSSHSVTPSDLLDKEKVIPALMPALQGLDVTGIWASGIIARGTANSAGQKHWFETGSYSLDCSFVTPEHKMVKGTFAGSSWDQVGYEKFIEDSRKKLEIMNRKPVKLKPGNYRAWFAPSSVGDFLGMFSWYGLSEGTIRQGKSAFLKMHNDGAKLSEKFSISEDFTSGIVPRFNTEGEVASEKLELIKNGHLINTLVSTRTANEYGIESNFADPNGEYIRMPVMSEGDLDEENVLKELGTGLYLSNLWYLNWSDNTGGRITGMTRYACFWVENGEIVAPIESMRFDDTLYNFFGDELEAVGSKAELLPTVDTYFERQLGGTICPGILVKSFSLTL
ncbi:MAG: TldD/PmbA family protein [Candidatus Marinimicrobia bacterium]|nr:TldD/PmbA family protein [Candidatus Neomarinimicrobiota bacterium]